MTREWWIPKERQYLADTEQWYCRSCGELTPIERNPCWNGEFTGIRPAPDWFVRCALCNTKHYQNGGFDCPNCGWGGADALEGDTLIKMTKPIYNMAAAMNYGGNPLDWSETHKCPICDTEFTFWNGNH